MTNFLKSIDGNDILITTGLAALGAGIGMVSVPAALITIGAVILVIGIFGAYAKGSAK